MQWKCEKSSFLLSPVTALRFCILCGVLHTERRACETKRGTPRRKNQGPPVGIAEGNLPNYSPQRSMICGDTDELPTVSILFLVLVTMSLLPPSMLPLTDLYLLHCLLLTIYSSHPYPPFSVVSSAPSGYLAQPNQWRYLSLASNASLHPLLHRTHACAHVPYPYFLLLGQVPIMNYISKKGVPSHASWKNGTHRYVNIPSCLIISILGWMTNRWNKAGTWKCSHKTTSSKFEYSRWRDTWKKWKINKACSRQYVQKCKIWAFCLINVLGRWFRPKAFMREGWL